MSSHVFAAIDIGSNAIKLKIVQTDLKTSQVLENITTPLAIGDEAFEKYVIEGEVAEQLFGVIMYFAKIMKEYQVEDYRAVATSSFRQARNVHYLVDTIYRQSGIRIEVIEDAVEKFITYKTLIDADSDFKTHRQEGLVVVELTSGASDVTFYRNDKLFRNDEIGVGSQHLKKMIRSFSKNTDDVAFVLEQYIATKVDYVKNILEKKVIRHYMALGGEMKTITELFFDQAQVISKNDFLKVYEELTSNTSLLSEKSLSKGKDWQEVLGSLVFFKVFLDILKAEEVLTPEVTLRGGLVAEMIEDYSKTRSPYRIFEEDPYYGSYQIAKRFGVNTKHAQYVEKLSRQIADLLKEEYSLSSDDIAILRHAALLHEIGKSVDQNDYYSSSAKIISGMRIFSLSTQKVERISRICSILGRFQRSDEEFLSFDLKDIQIAAILNLADSLDASKWQHLRIQKLERRGSHLKVLYEASADSLLEHLLVGSAARIMNRSFGLEVRLEER